MEDEIPKDIPEDIVKEASGGIPTRKTLIERLDNWSDWSSWDEFYPHLLRLRFSCRP